MNRLALATAAALTLALPGVVSAHVERSGYWPDPAPDCSITPCAGGAVPKARTLASALDKKKPGRTRVVCQPDSLTLLKSSIARARTAGYDIRPTDHRRLGKKSAKRLLAVNQRLFKLCTYREIQPAVTASGNNDRVVVMPGLYTEPTSRAVDDFPPECEQYRTTSEKGSGAVSYAYQYHCPNAQAL